MKLVSKLALGFSCLLLAVVVAGVTAQPSHAAQSTSNGSSLGNLFVLDRLFDGGGLGDDNNDKTDLGDLFILEQLFGGTTGVLSNGARTVVVESGDTLSAIALAVYGNANLYPQIAQANNIADPNLIFPGQVLTIPNVSTAAANGNGILGGGGTNLGDLFILDQLFNDGDGGLLNGDGGDGSDLGDLFVLDRLFSDGANGNGIFGGNGSGIFGGGSLGELFVLDRLFGDNGGGLFDNSGDNDLGDLFILDRLFGNGSTTNM